jgi:hypothetical protein
MAKPLSKARKLKSPRQPRKNSVSLPIYSEPGKYLEYTYNPETGQCDGYAKIRDVNSGTW